MPGPRKTVLVIDDDKGFCISAAKYLKAQNMEVVTAYTGKEGLDVCRSRRVDVVLLDQSLPDIKGHELCCEILDSNEHAKIIFITAYPSFENALEAVRAGAYDYLSKPFELDAMGLAVKRALHTLDLENVEELNRLKEQNDEKDIVLAGSQGGLKAIKELADIAASVDAPVLITGETGTGKSLIAKYIHYNSDRKGPYISINCAALPESLIEAELFGYERGAFTGAATSKRGIFELAEGGTLLLDEIGDMPVGLQSKLLGVLDDMSIRRLGSELSRSVDVRVISSTNTELEEAINKGRFRKDLYYRLSVIRIHVPPLRERIEDLPALCERLVKSSRLRPGVILPESEVDALTKYAWPGNVRELQNVLDRSLMLASLSTAKTARPSSLVSVSNTVSTSSGGTPPSPPTSSGTKTSTLAEMEKVHIINTLRTMSSNRSKTAQALGVSRSTLARKMKLFDIE